MGSQVQAAPAHLLTSFVSLIKALSKLRDPEQIQQCSEILSAHQKGNFAFDLAFKAYEAATSGDDDVRFFAALTIAIKLKQQPTPSEQVLALVREHILGWVIEAVLNHRPQYVIRRVFATLVSLFCMPACTWRSIIDDVAISISQKRVSSDPQLVPSNIETISTATSTLDARFVFDFAIILAEELRETAHNIEFDSVHERAVQNIKPMQTLLQYWYNKASNSTDSNLIIALATCHLRWLKYAKIVKTSPDDKASMSTILSQPVQILPLTTQSPEALEAVCSLLEKTLKDGDINLAASLLDEIIALLQSPFGQQLFSKMQLHNLEEIDLLSSFGNMALAYCRRVVQTAFIPSDPQPEQMLGETDVRTRYLSGLKIQRDFMRTIVGQVTKAVAVENCSESLAFGVVSFWENFVQDTRTHQLRKEAEFFLLSAMETLCQASQLAGEDQVEDFDVEEDLGPEDNFRLELRLRVRDLLQVAHDEYGLSVLEGLVAIVQANGAACLEGQVDASSPVWRGLETSLYFFTELSDSFHFSPEDEDVTAEDEALSSIFGSAWFRKIIDPAAMVPDSLRRLSLATLKEYSTYFGRHQAMLWPALDALIQYLQQPTYIKRAAETMSKLCAHNRAVIAQAKQGSTLQEVVQQYFGKPETPKAAQAYLLAAAASVAQALPAADEAAAIHGLLRLVREHHLHRLSLLPTRDPDAEADAAQTAAAQQTLKLLLAMSKACQSPSDTPASSQSESDWWHNGPGALLQREIMELLETALGTGSAYTTHLDLAATILRQGYREARPGPFVFASRVTVAFVTGTAPAHPQFGALASLAAEFVGSHARETDAVAALLLHIASATALQPDPRADVDAAAALLKAASTAAKSSPNALLGLPQEALRALLPFSLAALAAPESLPKLAAAGLWAALAGHLLQPAAGIDLDRLGVLLRDAGPHLVAALVRNYGGAAARSDLDRLVEPLRPIIARMPEAKAWLEAAVGDPGFEGGRSDAARRRQFVGALVMLRGGVKTRNVVREFWGSCRGVGT